jgi:hypothetical protein
MLNKILAYLSAIGAFFSAIFFVLFKMAREERNAEVEKSNNLNENLGAVMAGEKAEKEVKKENEELKEKVHNSNTLDSFNACTELLQK